jgi:hypothetical protein
MYLYKVIFFSTIDLNVETSNINFYCDYSQVKLLDNGSYEFQGYDRQILAGSPK